MTTTISSICFNSFSSTFTPTRRLVTPHAPPCSVTFRRPLPTISAVHATATASELSLASASTATISLYEVLGIQDYATCHEIKAAYRKLARVLHPDAAISKGQKDATSAADDFMRVHEAYATLSDPRKRADYDKMLLFKRRRIAYTPNYAVGTANMYATASSSGFSGYTRRRWETDQCW